MITSIKQQQAPMYSVKARPQAGPAAAEVQDKFQASDWKSQLADFGQKMQAREDLGIKDGGENAEMLAKILEDTSPTSDLKVIADRTMAKAGLLVGFPSGLLREVAAAQGPGEIQDGIVDLRHLPMVSVDNGELNPVTLKLMNESKDIDQCEFAERLPNGNIRVMVAIADVDCLVTKGSASDRQAMHNSATVYTDDKIFPMIAEKFSTDYTSLNGDQDRLAMVKEYQVTPEGEMVEPKVYQAYIHNHAKMAYESVNEWLTDGKGARPPQLENPLIAEQIRLQDEASQRLRASFYAKGSLDIESSEVKAKMENGEVIGMKVDEQNRAKDLVKYGMMAANMASMQVLESAGMPTMRRIVKTPEKWDRIVELAKGFEYNLPSSANAKELNRFLESRKAAEPDTYEALCNKVVRLVGRGEYVVSIPGEPIEGHFCLAVQDYGHTTAPNRRAPDLVNQRIEKAAANGQACPYSPTELEELATHFTAQEKEIAGVERMVHRSASAKLMEPLVGQSFDGVVARSDDRTTFVKLAEPPVMGKFSGPKVEEGDKVRVKLDKVNVERGWIDFSPAETQQADGFLFKP
ncbi:RNB domain-containing ribonuclease [bacterium]|nr:RNB domain-containing ribonuclease [bacterium]